MKIRTLFRFTLPKGVGIQVAEGRKVSGTMKLIQIKDLIAIERDAQVQRGSGAFYVVLLSKVITELGTEKIITRKTIEQLNPVDFAFLVDYLHQINHQILKTTTLTCNNCNYTYQGVFSQLGEA